MHVHDDERAANSPTGRKSDGQSRGASFCGLHWKIGNDNNGSEYLLVALRRETRFGFVKAFTNKRSETIRDAISGHAVAAARILAFSQ